MNKNKKGGIWNKKGGIGSLPALWIATIAIILLLIIFILSSSVIKELDESKAGLRMYEEAELEIESSIVNYIEKDYSKIVEIRSLDKNTQKTAQEILGEVPYEV